MSIVSNEAVEPRNAQRSYQSLTTDQLRDRLRRLGRRRAAAVREREEVRLEATPAEERPVVLSPQRTKDAPSCPRPFISPFSMEELGAAVRKGSGEPFADEERGLFLDRLVARNPEDLLAPGRDASDSAMTGPPPLPAYDETSDGSTEAGPGDVHERLASLETEIDRIQREAREIQFLIARRMKIDAASRLERIRSHIESLIPATQEGQASFDPDQFVRKNSTELRSARQLAILCGLVYPNRLTEFKTLPKGVRERLLQKIAAL